MQTRWRCDGRSDVRLSLGLADPVGVRLSLTHGAHFAKTSCHGMSVMLEPRLRRLETWRGSRRQTELMSRGWDRIGAGK